MDVYLSVQIRRLRHSHPAKFRIFCNKRLVYRRYTPSVDICRIHLTKVSLTFTTQCEALTYEIGIDDGG